MIELNNKDLIWNMADHPYSEKPAYFLKPFETALCLFSQSVAQLYSNYEMITVDGSGHIVALPNPHAYHDTFSNIDSAAITPTGIHIIPSEFIDGESEHDLSMVFRSKKSGKITCIPLAEGIRQLEKQFGVGNFLPVMMNKDLHLLDGNIPAMHLHRVQLNKLDGLSLFQCSDLQLTIETKMSELMA